ncbi:hypothetical protein ACQI4F_19790 [Mycolicibacterium vaccae]|uniref:hypothetical protein n=1 Tax=Mycolicibacterium vaccae TaxID=1810 RepID=UPI003CF4A259
MTTYARGPKGDVNAGGKLGLYSAIATALIGAMATIIVGALNYISRPTPVPTTTAETSLTPTETTSSDSASAYQFLIDDTGHVTVSGSAAPDVVGMYVLVGPKASGGYWGAYADVADEKWQAEVPTEPPWKNYRIEVHPALGPVRTTAAVQRSAFQMAASTQDPTVPPPPPDELLQCAEQYGARCFTGPQFAPPSIYESTGQ